MKITGISFSVLLLSLALNSCWHRSQGPGRSIIDGFEINRFQLEDLCRNLNEPMELEFLPDGRILFIERRGILKRYDPATKIVQTVGELPVHYINENGLLGLALDPGYATNHWLYLFYTDPVRKTYQHISRFEFTGDSLLRASEKVVLDYYIDVNNCCHFGGCLEFGPGGLLYISTGDNVGGTDFGPIDERPGHHLGDAQRTSANTMDLRGKILRIKPEPDGSYSIPEGNLFPPGTPNTRPEIYIMGVRNPLKFTVDPETGWLIWGEVGPNPGPGDPRRGPRSHEEINLAKSAGNFGWPYLLGDNQPYFDFNYETGRVGRPFNPDSLVNDSPNNTGLKALPPARKALIWYPNVVSDSFPLTGQGGGTACAGPVYHFDPSLSATGKFPRHFDRKLIIYEWMRSWILAVQLDESGRYAGMEEFLPANPFKKPIDLEFGPDGALYVLDYGSNWYAHNPDARLTRISYQYGNRPPRARITAGSVVGAVPLRIDCSARLSSDPDGDQLRYEWSLAGKGVLSTTTDWEPRFQQPGRYTISLTVRDAEGLTDQDTLLVTAGNAAPEIKLQLAGNSSFFRPGQQRSYQVQVSDLEDGSTARGTLPAGRVQVKWHYLPGLYRSSVVQQGDGSNTAVLAHWRGKELVAGSDCLACHAAAQQSVGPSWEAVSEKYKTDDQALEYLSRKILIGGKGVWSEQLMPAHPQHSPQEARAMVQYILALADREEAGELLPLTGILSFPDRTVAGIYLLTVTYTDLGANGMPPIRREVRQVLRPNVVPAAAYDRSERVVAKPYNEAGDLYAEIAVNGAYLAFEGIDLRGIGLVRVRLRSNANFIRIDLRGDSPEGPLLGSKRVDLPEKEDKWAAWKEQDWLYIDIPISNLQELTDLYFIFHSDKEESDYIYFDICQVHSIIFEQQLAN